jgi:hypothetical protein
VLISGVVYALAHCYRAASALERAREEYFRQRRATATARDEWLEYKAQGVVRKTRNQVGAVKVPDGPGERLGVALLTEPPAAGQSRLRQRFAVASIAALINPWPDESLVSAQL